MPRYPSSRSIAYSFGPGPWSPAVKAIIIASVGFFFLTGLSLQLGNLLGLCPALVVGRGWIWQPATYLFVHAGVFHVLLNMLMLWMFGTELERLWGTHEFLKYYFLTGIGAGMCTILAGVLSEQVWNAYTVGASGAIYGLLLAYGLHFPDRQMIMFPIPIPIAAKYFVVVMGLMALYASMTGAQSSIAHLTHLAGLVIGYVYLTRGRGGPLAELKYRWLKWRMARMRRKFDVVSGGRGGGWDGRYH